MTNDRSTQTFVAALLLVAALLVAMNRAVTAAPLGDWWLAGLLAVAGIVVAVYRPSTATDAPSEEQSEKPSTRESLPPATTGSASLSAGAAAVSAPAKPETTPAPPPSHVAKTEYAAPEQNTETQPPPAPPPTASDKATPKTKPETQVVMEATAAAPQPRVTEKMGEVTPETTKKVAEGKAEETPVAEKLTKKASRKVTAQETTGKGTAGKPDDLLRIDGIGPKIAAALLAAGIDSFQKLANTSETQTLEILRAAKVRVIANYTTWAQQASYAARGDWEGLDRFNSERKAAGGD